MQPDVSLAVCFHLILYMQISLAFEGLNFAPIYDVVKPLSM